MKTYAHPIYPERAAAAGDRLYVVDDDSTLEVIDIARPEALRQLGRHTFTGRSPIHGLAIGGPMAYLATSKGLRILDVRDPANIVDLGTWAAPAVDIRGVALDGNRVFLAEWNHGLIDLDATRPLTTTPAVFQVLPGSAQHIAAADERVYVGTASGRLDVFDSRSGGGLRPLGSHSFADAVQGIAVREGLAYVANGHAGLRILDVACASRPIEIGVVDTPGYAGAVALAGNLALVADWQGGLRIVDVTHPDRPFELGVHAPGWAPGMVVTAVAVAGDRATIGISAGDPRTVHTGRLEILDLAEPRALRKLGSVDVAGEIWDIAIADRLAFVAAGSGGLRVVDLSRPDQPDLAAEFAEGYVWSVDVKYRRVYLAESTAGLAVLLYEDHRSTAPLPTPVATALSPTLPNKLYMPHLARWFHAETCDLP